MKSVMRYDFSSVPTVDIQRSSFERNHGLKTTFDSGQLIPIYWDEALPGDTHSVRMSAFARMATPIHPVMDNMFLDTFFFAVPIRQIWDQWEKFNGSQDNPGDSTDFVIPQLTLPSEGFEEGTLGDYFGMPIGVRDLPVTALYHRCYARIWNQWFRDENLQDSVYEPHGDGPDDVTQYPVLRRGKRHDYFTSCLPWPQKDNGNTVLLPLGTSAPVVRSQTGNDQALIRNTSGTPASSIQTGQTDATGLWQNTGGTGIFLDPNGSMLTDLSNATAATINDLRQAFQVQRLFEKDARGGTRYVEIIKNHFNVTSPDFRLQRPEYLGGGSSPVNIHPVTQTSSSVENQPQGSLAAFGTVSANGHGFTKSFTEHCIVIGLASVRADLTYQEGLDRQFSRRTRFDFFWPTLANLGEQSVLNREIFVTPGTYNQTEAEAVFGYQERWAEYRYKNSRVTGKFRSRATNTLDPWHLSINFASQPSLNASFIEDKPPVDRVIAVTNQPQFIFDAYFKVRSARPMPVNSVPGLIDHF